MPVLNSVKALQRTRLFASLDKGGDHWFVIPFFGCHWIHPAIDTENRPFQKHPLILLCFRVTKLSHATLKKNEMATRLVSNFVLLSLESRNGTLQQEERTTKVEDRLVASPESDSVADTTDVASSPFPSARGTESSLVINELTAAEDTTYVTDSVDGRDNLFHRAEKSAIA